jgi:hypothetical protein
VERRQPDGHNFGSLMTLAVTAGAFLLVTWVGTTAVFLLLLYWEGDRLDLKHSARYLDAFTGLPKRSPITMQQLFPDMDENEPSDWYERLFLQVVVCLMAVAVLLAPLCILVGILAWGIVLPILILMETLESRCSKVK